MDPVTQRPERPAISGTPVDRQISLSGRCLGKFRCRHMESTDIPLNRTNFVSLEL